MFCDAIGRRQSTYPIKSCPSPLLAFQDGNLLHEFVGLQFEVMRASGRFAEIAVRVVLGISI